MELGQAPLLDSIDVTPEPNVHCSTERMLDELIHKELVIKHTDFLGGST